MLRAFAAHFREIGSAERAKREKAYMKSQLRFHGVSMPEVRRAAAEFARTHSELSRSELRSIVDTLFDSDWHDLRSVGIALLERRVSLLVPRDAAWLIGLVRRSPGWAHVDWLAVKVIGPVIDRHPSGAAVLRRWAKDDDFWVRRTALLAELDALRRGAGDFDLFAELAAPMLEEREFFIRKAIGWVLREVSKRRPALVRRFLAEHGARVSGLTRREASKYL